MNEHKNALMTNHYSRLLDDLRNRNLFRRCRTVSGPQGPKVTVDGRRVILMCSNNYLGLADHPALAQATSRVALDMGIGAGASRLISGTMELHCELERRLAKFKRAERCVLFNSGYQANVGVISAITGKNDVIYSDELNHASMIDGARLSRAGVRVYPHLDMERLDNMMRTETIEGRKVIITDGVFSMDGDPAPIRELVELKNRYGAQLIVDEAHATGVIGPGGRGLVAQYGLEESVDVVVGTLGKALGSFGAFAVGCTEIVEWLINTARSFVYTTALPPPVVAASLAALDIIEQEPERIEALKWAASYMRERMANEGLNVENGKIPIIPLVVGNAQKALDFASELLEEGVFCQAIRPPSVPEGTSRLRITVMASHTRDHLDRAIDAIAGIARKLGVIAK